MSGTTLDPSVVPIERPRFYAAYEFSKRKFAKKYGKQLPVWTLLASGATGGVRFRIFSIPPGPNGKPLDFLLAGVLPAR